MGLSRFNWQPNNCQYAIGSTSSTLVALATLRVPEPDKVLWSANQEELLRGDLTYQAQGYRSCRWLWATLHESQLRSLIRSIFSSETDMSAAVYIITPAFTGWYTGAQVFRCYLVEAKRPKIAGEDEGNVSDRLTNVFNEIAINFIVRNEITSFA